MNFPDMLYVIFFFNIFHNFIVYILIICYTLSKRDVSCNVLLNVSHKISLNA